MSALNRIDQHFQSRTKKALFIPYICCGDPSVEVTLELLFLLEGCGADIIELGVPYSDPLADGPVIQAASMRALQQKVYLPTVLDVARRARSQGLKSGLILFGYYNPFLQYGPKRLVQDAKEAGFDGLLIPDLPLEEAEELGRWCAEVGLHLIPLAAPTSMRRLEGIARVAQGMIYCVSSLGVTGMRNAFHSGLIELLKALRHKTPLPLAVGFGVSNGRQFAELAEHCDAVVVGSAIVKQIEEHAPSLTSPVAAEKQAAMESLKQFLLSLQQEV